MASDSTGASRATGAPAAPVSALVTADWLAEHLDDPGIRIADVRWYLPYVGRSGREEYEAGHIPGAVFVDLDSELAGPPGSGPGRHPIPMPEAFGEAMSRAGIGSQTHVVGYDDSGGAIAARLWWLLRYSGHERVSVLDGGLAAWRAGGYPENGETPSFAAVHFAARRHPERVVGKDAVDRLRQDSGAVVLDARAVERYEGRVDPVDSRPGHIPGAKSAPYAENLATPVPVFLAREELRARYERLGVSADKTVVAYCGSGVTACHTLLALHLAGYRDAFLYEGSWSDWSRDPLLPAAMGRSAE